MSSVNIHSNTYHISFTLSTLKTKKDHLLAYTIYSVKKLIKEYYELHFVIHVITEINIHDISALNFILF